MSTLVVGSVRPSQLLWTYGPGSLIDLPNLSVLTMGLDNWEMARCSPVNESRLLASVKSVLGPQVQSLRFPPIVRDSNEDPFSAEGKYGVPVRPFPRWLRCVRCGLLAEFDSELFKIKESPYRPDETSMFHATCQKGSRSDAVPSRFLVACTNGHLDDLPWHWFVHGGSSTCKGTLRFFERGASLQTENLWVKCDLCDSARSLVNAFGESAQRNLPACRGRHPHLDTYDEECDEPLKTVLLGSSNGWFAITQSVLAMPTQGNTLKQLIEDGWSYFEDIESEGELKGVLKALKVDSKVPGIERFEVSEIWKAIDEKRNGLAEPVGDAALDLKGPEWSILTHPSPPQDYPHFLSESVDVPHNYKSILTNVLLLKRLREVNALVGFTRVESPDPTVDPEDRPVMAPLAKGRPAWIPASEVNGEGIFIRFDEELLSEWEQKPGVIARSAMIETGHKGWRNARRKDPIKGYPGIRFTMIHTFAHLLIRELALECGYNAASIRERIYADFSSSEPMAGLILYTAAADSEGTLGGLVELGKPEHLGQLINQALYRASICSSDPLCSEHNPEDDRTLHGAACHACTFVAETSCERCNHYLDRALVVGTFDTNDAAFFTEPGIRDA